MTLEHEDRASDPDRHERRRHKTARDADRGDEQPGDAGPDEAGGVPGGRVQRDGAGDVLLRDELRQVGLARRQLDGVEHAEHQGEERNEDERSLVGGCQQGKGRRVEEGAGLRGEQDLATIEAVRDDARDRGEDQTWQELEADDEPQLGRAGTELEREPGDGHQLHPDGRAPDEHSAEIDPVPGLAQGAEPIRSSSGCGIGRRRLGIRHSRPCYVASGQRPVCPAVPGVIVYEMRGSGTR